MSATLLWMSLITLPPSMVLIFVASPFGLEAVAATQFISAPVQVFVAVSFVGRRIGVSWGEIAKAVGRSVVVALCSAAAPAAVVVWQGGFSFNISHQALAFAVAGAAVGVAGGPRPVEAPAAGRVGERNETRPPPALADRLRARCFEVRHSQPGRCGLSDWG